MPKLKNLSPQQRDLLLSNFIDHIGHECRVTIEWYEHGIEKGVGLAGAEYGMDRDDIRLGKKFAKDKDT